MKKLTALVLSLLLVLTFATGLAENQKIRVGATPSPHAEILELVKEDLAALGFDLEIVEFTEYPLPNPALAAKEIDANYFQHIPYLDSYNDTVAENEKLLGAIGVHYEPYGIYPGKTATLEEVKDGAIITVTNDPANETRALLLLQEAGLIKLADDVTPGSSVTVLDIVENPLNLDIKEVDASTLPATLADADFAVINGNFAIGAGLSPAKDAIFLEAAEGVTGKEYTNYVVIRPEDKDADFVKALEEVLLSEKVGNYILENEEYKGGVFPAFEVEKAE